MDLSKEFKQNERNQTKSTLVVEFKNAELGELNFVLFQRKGFHSLGVFLYCKVRLCKWILRQRLSMTKFY